MLSQTNRDDKTTRQLMRECSEDFEYFIKVNFLVLLKFNEKNE
jgi:hypothetical protein